VIKCGTVIRNIHLTWVAGVQPISSVRIWTPRLEQEKLGTSRRTLT
jgi:hypothetical protein